VTYVKLEMKYNLQLKCEQSITSG